MNDQNYSGDEPVGSQQPYTDVPFTPTRPIEQPTGNAWAAHPRFDIVKPRETTPVTTAAQQPAPVVFASSGETPNASWSTDPLMGASAPEPAIEPVSPVNPGASPSFVSGVAHSTSSLDTPLPITAAPGVAGSGQSRAGFSKKKVVLFAGLAVVISLLVGSGAFAYSVYTKPENALGDAMHKAVTSKSVAAVGGLKMTANDSSGSIFTGSMNADFDIKSTDTSASIDLTLGADLNGYESKVKVKDVKASLRLTPDQQTYGRVSGLNELADALLDGDDQKTMRADVQPIINELEGVWMKFPVNKASDDDTCVQDVMRKYSSDVAQQLQVRNAYVANQFVTIKNELKSERINGRDSVHYGLAFNETTALNFSDELKRTDVYKAVIACDASNDITQDEVKDVVRSLNDATYEVWIDRWTHEFTKMAASASQDGVDTTLSSELWWNGNVSVDAPSGAKDFETVMKSVEQKASDLFYGNDQAVMFQAEDYDQAAYNQAQSQARLQAQQIEDCKQPSKTNTATCKKLHATQVQGVKTPVQMRQSDLLNLLYL